MNVPRFDELAVVASLMAPPGRLDAYDAAAAMLEALRRPPWHTEAACLGVGTAAFFPERGASSARARALCGSCAVGRERLDDALADPLRAGVWGGTTARERAAMRAEAEAA